MRPIEPLPLNHSWPLYDLRTHLAPILLDSEIARSDIALAERGLGLWHCNLTDDSLNWTAGVYDIFGLERDLNVPRPLAVSLYAPDSREPMERLRAYAIKHKRGFTLDVDINQADGAGRCAMRLIAAPIIDAQGNVIGLHGVKQLLPDGALPSRRLDPTIFVML
ncbi:diguanylate cyclase [Sphingobium sp. CAP-1]|uniref:diguanylate cyclase n=1 Tax=Sphingobium sp. CAP-1 TaxID=2676077 RepID=UPI0012BB261B|nr:diguanylate cyclase [Sphingobium sp. CAP-1]QGP79496.1 diguanylate cyclase [Sphingobium sp. CAP-1]